MAVKYGEDWVGGIISFLEGRTMIRVSKHRVRFLIVMFLSSGVAINFAEAGARIPSTVPNFGLYIVEGANLNGEPDNFYANAGDPDANKIVKCATVDDELCTQTTMVNIIHNLPTCAVDATFDCIKSVWAVGASGKRIDGIFISSLPVKGTTDRPAIPSMLLSASNGFGGLWKIPGVVNGGGTENYFVSTRISAWPNKKAGAPLRDSKFYYGLLQSGIIPVKPVTGNYAPVESRPNFGISGAVVRNAPPTYTPEGEKCTVVDTGVCQLPQDFPVGYRFGMSVQLAQKVSGWFHGRIALPQIGISALGNGQVISIEAEPVKISTLDFTIPNAQIPDSIRKAIFADVDWHIKVSPNSVQAMLEPSEKLAMLMMNDMLPTIGDKATKTVQYWSYRALNDWQNPEIKRCATSTDELGGVVTTNALTYSDGPPTYDKETGSLQYKVASPHLEADGTVASGSYDLAIKSEVARCIYGFSNAPIRAEISITSPDGEKRIATTVVNEKNGWLYLSAKGFSFSSPTINVKLLQEKAVVIPAPVPSGSPVAVAPVIKKSTTITCIKGKLSKKITAVKPKCPTGYKKR